MTSLRLGKTIGIAALWVLTLGCTEFTNDPINDVYLAEGETYTQERAAAGQNVTLRFNAERDGPVQIVQLRMWSLGQLAGLNVQVSSPAGQVIWTGSSAGTELQTPALRLYESGQYIATIQWVQGKGIAGYHYEHLYSGKSPISKRQQAPLTNGRVGHSVTVLKNNQVLITGGDNAASIRGHHHIQASDTAEVLTASTGEATATSNMNTARSYHTATRIIAPEAAQDGHVLIAGGLTNMGAIRSTEIFDPETNTFEPGPQLPGARAYQSALAIAGTGSFLDGTIILAGGEFTRPGPQHDLVEGLYNEVDENPTNLPTDTIQKPERSSLWYFRAGDDSIKRVGQEMTYGRIAPTLTLLNDGRILILGGGIDSLPTAPGCSTQTLGCRCTNSVALCTQYQCTADECNEDQYVNYVRKDVATDLVEVYDTGTGELTVLDAKMKKARVGHTATRLPNGQILIAGGASAHRRNFQSDEGGLLEYARSLDSVEVFDPAFNTFRLLPVLSIPREGHSAMLSQGNCALNESRCVLLAGGQRSVPGTMASVTALSFFNLSTEQFHVQDISTPARVGSITINIPAENTALLIGGTNDEGISSETQSAEILTWTPSGTDLP